MHNSSNLAEFLPVTIEFQSLNKSQVSGLCAYSLHLLQNRKPQSQVIVNGIYFKLIFSFALSNKISTKFLEHNSLGQKDIYFFLNKSLIYITRTNSDNIIDVFLA